MSMKGAACALGLALLLLACPSTAGAESGAGISSGSSDPDGGSVAVSTHISPGGSGHPRPKASRYVDCSQHDWVPFFDVRMPAPTGMTWLVCRDSQTANWTQRLVSIGRPKPPSVADVVA